MGGTKCLRLGTCEFEDMGGVLQNDSSMRRRQENETWRSVLERSALAEVRSRSVLEAHVREGSHGAAPGLVRPS